MRKPCPPAPILRAALLLLMVSTAVHEVAVAAPAAGTGFDTWISGEAPAAYPVGDDGRPQNGGAHPPSAETIDAPDFVAGGGALALATPGSPTTAELTRVAGSLAAVLVLGLLYVLFRQALPASARDQPDRAADRAGPMPTPTAAAAIASLVTRACGLATLTLAGAVLLGWALDIVTLKNVLPGLVAMQPWTATGIALSGAALLASTVPQRSWATVSTALAASVAAVGTQALVQYATGVDSGVDGWLFPGSVRFQPAAYAHPGRPSVATSVALTLFGVATVLSHRRETWARAAFSTVGTAGLLLSTAGLVGYMMDLGALESAAFFRMLALHTALALTLLFVGALASRPRVGWVALLSGDPPGAASARMLLPAVVIGPLLLALLFEKGRTAGLYGSEFRLALATLTTIICLATGVLWSGIRLNRAYAAERAATEEVRRSERRYRTLVDTTSAVTWSFPPSGLLVRPEPAWTALTGQTVPEMLGAGWTRAIHPDDCPGFTAGWTAAVARGEPLASEHRVRRRGGGWRWMRVQAAPIRDPGGNVAEWIGVHTDITERKEAEAALRESEERLQLTYEATDIGAWDFSPATGVTVWSPKMWSLLGIGPDRTASVDLFLEYVIPEDRARVRERYERALATGPLFEADFRIVREDGMVRHLLGKGRMIGAADGGRRMMGIVFDITDRKDAEEALFREKELAEVTLKSIGDAVIVTDAVGKITFLNPVAEQLTGYLLEDAQDLPLEVVFNIVNEETKEPAENPVSRCLREDRIVGLANHTVLISRDGREYAIADSAAPIRDRAGTIVGVVLVFHDVSETRRLAQQLQHDAAHDALTGLVNRREFERRLERMVAAARQYRGHHALCYIDLDQFKLVNDTAGHVAGDTLLKQVRGLLAGKFRERDTLARVGGDEFALLLDNCGLPEACRIAETIVGAFRKWRFSWRGQTFQVGASVGVVSIGPISESAAQVLAQADVACYTAKEQGRDRVHIYQGEGVSPSPHHARMLLAATLVDAQINDRFQLFGQPIVPLSNGHHLPPRWEILLRLIGESGEYIMPDIVIPAAERYGMMANIDRWVIGHALGSVAAGAGDVALSINLSGASLNTDDLGDFVLSEFRRHDVRPDTVCFEITETAAVHNLDQAVRFIEEVRQLGCTIALDDFGSGMSSFRYLRKLPIDYLKIDGSFVRNLCSSDHDEVVVTAINEVGHKLGIRTIAEYVHDQPTADRARSLSIDFAQGYAFGAPAPFSTTAH